jgi:hypothetical protein
MYMKLSPDEQGEAKVRELEGLLATVNAPTLTPAVTDVGFPTAPASDGKRVTATATP